MTNEITQKQLFAIYLIEIYTKHKFKGYTKLEAIEFISKHYDFAKSEVLKYDCMIDKYGE